MGKPNTRILKSLICSLGYVQRLSNITHMVAKLCSVYKGD